MPKQKFKDKLINYSDSELLDLYKRLFKQENFGFAHVNWKFELVFAEVENRNLNVENILEVSIVEIQGLDDIFYNSNIKEYYPIVAEKLAVYNSGIEIFDDIANDGYTKMVNILYDEKTMFFNVVGDSMIDAQIYEDDILIVIPCINPKSNTIIAAMVDGKRYVKRLIRHNGSIYLKSDNSKYSDWQLHPWNEFRIIGQVIGKYQNLS